MTQPKAEKSQADKFREAAKEIQADTDDKHFEKALKIIARAKRTLEPHVKLEKK